MSAALAQLPLPFVPVRRAFEAPVIAAESNREARAWLTRTAAWPQRRLVLWGPPGCGKSSLLADWARREGATMVPGGTLRFQPRTGALAIDDAALAPPLAMLHTLNAAQEAGHAVLLVASAPPSRWQPALPDLDSRLRATTAVAIDPPEDTLLHALLARLLAERQLRPAGPTLDWLLARLPRTHAAVVLAVERLDRAAQVLGMAITPVLARLVLPDLLADPADLPDTPSAPGTLPPDDDFASSAAAASPIVGGLL